MTGFGLLFMTCKCLASDWLTALSVTVIKPLTENERDRERENESELPDSGGALPRAQRFNTLRHFKCVQNGRTLFCTIVIQIISMKIEITSYSLCSGVISLMTS